MSRNGTADAAVGIMDGAYFTSRKDILDFFNDLLEMNIQKIEQTATGAVACQVMDYIYPGSIPMKRVDWGAKSSYEYIQNYKLLQAAFSKHRVQRYVDVDKLIRAKYQDNLEFCQWLKAFYEQCNPPYREDYDAVGRRELGKGGRSLPPQYQRGGGGGGAGGARRAAAAVGGGGGGLRRTQPSPSVTTKKQVGASDRGVGTAGGGGAGGGVRSQKGVNPPSRRRGGAGGDNDNSEAIVADANLMKKNAELKSRNAELELTVSGIERERDFYFEKLRGIEVMLQVHEERGADSDPNELVKKVFKVLYATSDDNVVVNDEGELVGDGGEEESDLLNEENLAAGVEVHVGLCDDVEEEESLLGD